MSTPYLQQCQRLGNRSKPSNGANQPSPEQCERTSSGSVSTNPAISFRLDHTSSGDFFFGTPQKLNHFVTLCEIDSVEFQSNTKLSSHCEWIRCQHKMPSWILRSRHLIGWFECQNHEVCSRMQLGWRHLNCPCVRINCQTVDGTV
jgi:hypothetical protein